MAAVQDSEFHTEFTYSPAIPHQPGVTRRDPSPVIRVGGLYHVWYSRSTHDSSGYFATVWHATSPDGRQWTERGEAVATGSDGAWDANGVFTPTTLIAEGRYWLLYTAVPKPFDNAGGASGTPTAIGIASADSPDGPWRKFERNPVLRPGPAGAWDSHRVDDACMVVREGKYWLYYKGRQLGLGPAETKMGVAIAERPTGPYVKSEHNPLIGSGHEVCVWPHRQGVAALVAPCGPEGGTVQYGADGIHFAPQATVVPPSAPGPYRTDAYADVEFGTGITWGLCQNRRTKDRPFLQRFDCDLTARRQ